MSRWPVRHSNPQGHQKAHSEVEASVCDSAPIKSQRKTTLAKQLTGKNITTGSREKNANREAGRGAVTGKPGEKCKPGSREEISNREAGRKTNRGAGSTMQENKPESRDENAKREAGRKATGNQQTGMPGAAH